MAPLAEAFVRIRPDFGTLRIDVEQEYLRAGRSAAEAFRRGFGTPNIPPPSVPNSTTRVKVDVDTGAAKQAIQGLLFDIARLAAIPVGATLAVGIGALAGSAAAAGIGFAGLAAVAVPSITRIKEALTAQAAAQKNSAATEAASQGQAFAIAGARQALASALRNAEYSHAQALDGVRSAERNLADAQQSSINAQKALGTAREEARRQLEDMNLSLADSALGLRGDQLSIDRARDALARLNDTRQDAIALEQAQLGVRQAQQRLNEVLANPKSTQLEKDAAQLAVTQAQEQLRQQQQVAKQRELERKEAQLAFDQAQQRYKDDLVARKREEAAAKAAAKAGVDGSTQVTAAREALKQANDKVAESERSLAKARAEVGRQDQQSADSVASARRGLAQAMASGVSSSNALNAAMAKLSPSARTLLTQWVGLTKVFDTWQRSMEPKVLPLFGQGIEILKGQIPSLTPIVRGAASAVDGLLDKVEAGSRSPGWVAFRSQLTALVPASITGLGTAVGNVAVGFGRIIQAFLPYAPQTLSFIDRMTARFREWSGGLGQSPGFTRFMAYVQTNGPTIGQTIATIAQALAHVTTSIGPLGGSLGLGALSTFGLLARALNNLSPRQIQQLAVAFVAVRTALAGYKIVNTAVDGVRSINAAFSAGSSGPLWARGLTLAWTGLRSLASAAWSGVNALWAHARAAAASALATIRLRVAAAGSWIASQATALWSVVTAMWASARAGAAAALASARMAVATAASTAASWAARTATAAWAAAQFLLSQAWAASPIGVVVLGIVALIAVVVLAYKNVGWFRNAVDAAWSGIQSAFSAAWGFIQPIFAAIRDWITGTLAPAFLRLWQNVIAPSFQAIGALISAAWTSVIQPVFSALWGVITNVLAPAFTWLWRNVLAPSFTGIGLLISFAWTNVIQPVFNAVWAFVQNVLGPVFNWLWRNVIQPSFIGIGLLITTAWNTVIRPVFQAVWTFLSTVLGPVFNWLWRNVIQPSFTGIGLLIGLAWNTVIHPIFAAVWGYITNTLGPIFTWLWHTIIAPVFAGIGAVIGAVWTNGIQPVFGALKNAVGAVADSFGVGAGAIKTAWAKIQDYAKTPVNFIIGTVYNKGIRGLWNQVINWLHLPGNLQLGEIPLLASGGTLNNPTPVSPMVTNGPMAIVGEGRRQYPEFVIPTDPQYRGRATALWSQAGAKLQQFAGGGVLGFGDNWWDKIKDAAGNVTDLAGDALDLIANPKKVWDKLVKQLPSTDGLEGPWGKAVGAVPGKSSTTPGVSSNDWSKASATDTAAKARTAP
jgi:hypothetical protein